MAALCPWRQTDKVTIIAMTSKQTSVELRR
jgi:hypothetical protein